MNVHLYLCEHWYCFVLQLLDTGFFHADPHPGNMIRTPDGKLAILDFGNSSSSSFSDLSKYIHLVTLLHTYIDCGMPFADTLCLSVH